MAKAIVEYPEEFEIDLRLFLEYDAETGLIRWIKARKRICVGDQLGGLDKNGYLVCRFNQRFMKVHRIAWFLYYGYWPEEIDHWDGDKSNNAIFNLRDVDHWTNQENRVRANKNNRAGLLGVRTNDSRYSKPFSAIICFRGAWETIGHYDNEMSAHIAFIERKRELILAFQQES